MHSSHAEPSGYPQGVTVKPISSTAIEISWNEVPMMEQNGNITHYEILYTPVNSLLEQQPKVSTTGGPTLISLLQGLEEYTIYSVSVRAVTIVGSGPLSPPQMNRTFEDSKQLWSLLCVVNTSLNVEIEFCHTPSSVTVMHT